VPELPDVEILRQYLQATSLHKRIVRAEVNAARELKTISARNLSLSLQGRSIISSERHGKHLFANLDNAAAITMHFGMTGYLRYHQGRKETPEYTRLQLRFTNGYRLSYSCMRRLGRLGLISNKRKFLNAMRLGPDALALEREEFVGLMGRRRGQIKAALMDQSLLAGIGNVYSDEILFQARLHPRVQVRDLNRERLRRLHKVLQRVLTVAVSRRADPNKMPLSWLTPRRGKKLRCPSGCGGVLKKISAAGRSAWFCPVCQPEP